MVEVRRVAKASGGLAVAWGAEHRSGKGKLISRQVSITPPVINCVRITCLVRYTLKSLLYTLTCLYHRYRGVKTTLHKNYIIVVVQYGKA